jgi:hypothetical protein
MAGPAKGILDPARLNGCFGLPRETLEYDLKAV